MTALHVRHLAREAGVRRVLFSTYDARGVDEDEQSKDMFKAVPFSYEFDSFFCLF